MLFGIKNFARFISLNYSAIGMSGGIKITCKNCGKQADSSAFILDPVIKKVVCPECVRKRKIDAISQKNATDSSSDSFSRQSSGTLRVNSPNSSSSPAAVKSSSSRPLDWDDEDDRLEKLARQKQKTALPQSSVTYIDDEKAKVACTKCKYKYVYNVYTGVPKYCPYCGTTSPSVKPKY
jgi:Zn finger protein HypA/HybF involved in hydrogenase expression